MLLYNENHVHVILAIETHCDPWFILIFCIISFLLLHYVMHRNGSRTRSAHAIGLTIVLHLAFMVVYRKSS